MNDDPIVFEKVTIAEARAARMGTETHPQTDPKWVEQRNPLLPSDLHLLEETQAWLTNLPERARPVHLTQRFPRIANRIFAAWRRPEACIKVFDELMMDSRGTRQGFPMEVARDITNLRVYYTTEVYKMKQDTWVLTA